MAVSESQPRARAPALPTTRINSEAEGQRVVVWDYAFTWTKEHPDVDEIRGKLYSYDKLATDALDILDKYRSAADKEGCPHPGSGKKDLYALLEEHHKDDEVLNELWTQVSQVPDWVDWEQIKRGQQVTHQFSYQVVLGLLIRSLVGGMGAWRVVETLGRTGGFGINVTKRRLLETFQHFLEVNADLESVKPGGKGFESTVRVRLLHATVRRRMMKLNSERADYYDQETWGVPINDLHQMGTIAAYSTALIYEALPRQGIILTEQQTADYVALWRWIGYLLGTPTDWLATPALAKATSEAIITSEIEPSRNSQIIANNILTAESNVPPMYARREYLAALTYRLNGNDLSTALAVEKPWFYWRILVWIQCKILIGLGLAWPYMTEAQRERRRKNFVKLGYEMITNQKTGGLGETTKFHFQYVPEFNTKTEMGPIGEAIAASTKGLGSSYVKIWLSCVFVGLLAMASSVFYLHRTANGALWEVVGEKVGEAVEQGWKSWETLSVPHPH